MGRDSRTSSLFKGLLTSGIIAVAASSTQPAQVNKHSGPVDVLAVCELIAKWTSSATDVYYPFELQYVEDVSHYALSSSLDATCSVEPGSAEDVGIILAHIGLAGRVPFAVKGGGHAMNPNFSTTTGVQVSMTRFNEVHYDATAQTATIGAGLIWDNVYAALEPYGVTFLGVAGLTLGGGKFIRLWGSTSTEESSGYSWKTNQHGLVLDTVQTFELVLPTGRVINVTETSHPDLFYGLKGGFNNFGVVTRFTLKTFPQTEVWGGILEISGDYSGRVNAAVTKFYENVTDPKASLIMSYGYQDGSILLFLQLFYDAPTPPSDIFQDLLDIPADASNISTRSYLSLVQASPVSLTLGFRGYYNSIPLADLTLPLLDTVFNLTEYWGTKLAAFGSFTYSMEPFLPNILTHGGMSAYPPSRARRFLPSVLSVSWTDLENDAVMYDAAVQAAAVVIDAATAQGQDLTNASRYGNYAIYGTHVEDIYGDHLDALRVIKRLYDPSDVMGLTGGWKF
ncbi:FAD-binding domain-containing protein [Amylocystis lapponica]|nr:FAD-binding domain-containing protein [Amylocystis lapponica]